MLVISISLRVSIAVLKYCGQKQLGEEGFAWLTLHDRGPSLMWKLKQRPRKGGAGWLAPHAWLSLLSSSAGTPSPGPAPPTVSWALSRGSLFSVNSNLCQVDKPTTKNPPASRKSGHCVSTRTWSGLQHPGESRIQ